MQLLEHEAKSLAAAVGLPVPDGRVAGDPAEAEHIARELGGRVVVKAQVPAGGRGKAGGVRTADGPAQAAAAAAELLGRPIGRHVPTSVLVERHVPHVREVYVAVTVDARARSAALLLGAHGGVDVEDDPSGISAVPVPVATGLRPWHVRNAAHEQPDLPAPLVERLVPVAEAAYRLFAERRAVLVELNPVLVTETGEVTAADVRVVPEDGLTAPAADDPSAQAAREHGFDFVTLDPAASVGLVSTGAGGSLLLVDLLADAGAPPINFCDIRSGGMRGSTDRLVCVLRELRRFERLSCLAVNVFAGITDITEFTRLLVRTVELEPPTVPLIVRVEGNGAEEARRLLDAAGLSYVRSLAELVDAVAATGRNESAA